VMGVRDFLIDLSEDRSLMLYSTVALGPRTQTPGYVLANDPNGNRRVCR
jgi:hypothetical protein